MRTKPIIAGVVLIAVLLLIAIVFLVDRPSPPAVKVRHVKSVQSGREVELAFEVTNQATTTYFVYPVYIEFHDGPVWRKCRDFRIFPEGPLPAGPRLQPFTSETFYVKATNLPAGHHFRLTAVAGKETLKGLGKTRFKEWLLGRSVPLFNKVFFNKTPILSEEFTQPEPK